MSIKVTNWVWARSQSRNGARLVMLALADRADDDGFCWPSIDDLAQRTRLSPRAVQKGIATLVTDGELKVENGGGRHRSNRYQIVPKPCTSDGVTHQEPRTSDGVSVTETPHFEAETPNSATETPHFAPRNPVQSAPEPSVEPSRKPSENLLQDGREPTPPTVAADTGPRHPTWLEELMDEMSLAGINLPWKFLGDDMIRIHNDIKRLGIPLMVADAVDAKASANKPPFSSRFFYPRWHAIRTPAQPVTGGNVVALRGSVPAGRQQQETDAQFDRAMARAQARMQQESS
ncbi:helix-turn-helix domain-containing protein [Streptomyces erythrochromogenes]|uniref:helix-turn-helix domain-containing protein n=1 Tax=Streptomyces erythrochromogenes TaxID=285574 RepID=UPI002258BE32|nr:helix-turn-helix domain-containing protein [Streptomyces erythrochromogenes]MCX5584236.1 helix-turn-helix domain-containing protein [Streptomyces erythrochromogenes]